VLELGVEELPVIGDGEDAAHGWTVSRWLGGLGLGLVSVADPGSFSWAGPWIARLAPPEGGARYVVMYGVPSGVVWDPAGDGAVSRDWVDEGFVVAAADIALARPPRPDAPTRVGIVESIWVAQEAGAQGQALEAAEAFAGRGLGGDRYVTGAGTFPSGPSGSALTLIEAEVCESFEPSLEPEEHRRNIVVRGLELNGLVGREFAIGRVRCRGVRLCEPCMVAEGYARQPVLRRLVHRGGLRADILEDGEINVGDPVAITSA
jgi:MOSC domain-containing protein YiiM